MHLREFIFLEAILLPFLVWELHRRLRLWMLSPVWLLLGGYTAIAVLGWSLLNVAQGPPGHNFMFRMLPTRRIDDTFGWFLLVMIAFSAGSLLWFVVSQQEAPEVRMQRGRALANEALWLAIAFVPILILVAGAGGIKPILSRTEYITGHGNPLKIAGMTLTPLSVILTGYGFLSFKNGLARVQCLLTALIYFLVCFALATRVMAMIPALFTLGMFVARPDQKATKLMLMLAGVGSLALLPIPLVLRDQRELGLIPFTKFLLKGGRILSQHSGKNIFRYALGSLLVGFPLTAYVGFVHSHLNGSYLATEFNPLPGALTNWYSVLPHLMVNQFTPFNALGELLNHGVLFGAAFYFALGFYVAHVDWKIRGWANEGKIALSLMLYGLCALFVLLSLQYHLRDCMRLLYYAMTLEFGLALMLRPFPSYFPDNRSFHGKIG